MVYSRNLILQQRCNASNAAKAELLKSSKTQLTPVTIFSVYCHLASASGAWWQKLRDWGGASSLRPSGSLTQTLFHKHLQDSLLTVKNIHILIIRIAAMCTYPVQPVCTSLPSLLFILLFIKSHILFCTSYLFCTFLYSIAHFTLYFSLFTYIYALVLCYFYIICIILHCPLSGPDLIYISLLIIPCIIYYVTNK